MLIDIPLDERTWAWGGATPQPATYGGRECISVDTMHAVPHGVELLDGVLEMDIAVSADRGFPGVMWRIHDAENFESFFVRPHQVGNPDAVQYTPVSNGISSWQLYHGPGFWAPIRYPIGDWFTIRAVFSGDRAEVFVADMETPALSGIRLRRPVAPGGVGLSTGGVPIHVARFAYADRRTDLPRPRAEPGGPGTVLAWDVSDPFSADEMASDVLDPGFLAARQWTRLAAEPSGLADLSRVNPIRDGRNAVLARVAVTAEAARSARLELGYSDRVALYLNGRPLFRGDAGYRSRDYRFLGSIGYHDAVYLPLAEGENQLVAAVAEDFGGWGIQARFTDPAGLVVG